jgi:hypothetical protein
MRMRMRMRMRNRKKRCAFAETSVEAGQGRAVHRDERWEKAWVPARR